MNLLWHPDAWEDYVSWQAEDPRALKRINKPIKETLRTPFEGLGKPEPLRGDLSGWWSRRIDAANRLVYKVTDESIIIAACKNHY